MRDAYQELGRPGGAPLATLEDAFKGCDRLVLYDRQDDGWHPFCFDVPPNLLRPGDPGGLPTFWEIAATACRWALGRWRELGENRKELRAAEPAHDLTPAWFEDLARDVASDLLRLELAEPSTCWSSLTGSPAPAHGRPTLPTPGRQATRGS